MMLAEPRKKREKYWFPFMGSEKPYWDESGFGAKMLKKMGWQEGSGLGKNLEGLTAPVRPKYNLTRKGFSAVDEKCVDFIDHQGSFNDLLADLNAVSQESSSEFVAVSSLEERSRKLKRRIHYRKFTAGKDVSKYSLQDFEGIMGKKVMQDNSAFLEKTVCNLDTPIKNLPEVTEEHVGAYNCRISGKSVDSSHVHSVAQELKIVTQGGKKKGKTGGHGVEVKDIGMEKANRSISVGKRTSWTAGDGVRTTDTPKKWKKQYVNETKLSNENHYSLHSGPENNTEENRICLHGNVNLFVCIDCDDFHGQTCNLSAEPKPKKKKKNHSNELRK